MQYKSTKGYSGWSQLAILMVFVGIGMVITSFFELYIGSKMLGATAIPLSKQGPAIMEALLLPKNANYAQLIQISGVFFLFFSPCVAYLFICYGNLFWGGFSRHFNIAQLLLGFLIMGCTSFFADPFAGISKSLFAHFPYWNALAKDAEIAYNNAIASMSGMHTPMQFVTGIFIIAFLPGLFEELFFRGVLQNLFMRWWKKPLVAILITAILFSLVHASYYLFITRFFLGCTLGLLFYRSKNIWINIFAHFINNLIALSQLFYLNNKTGIKPDISNMDTPLPLWTVFITFTILCGLYILFEKVSKKNRQKIIDEELSYSSSNNPLEKYV